MNTQIKILFIVITLLCSARITKSYAQNILQSTIIWSSDVGVSQADNSTLQNYTCTFTTNGNGSIDWNQNGGKHVTHFTVTSTIGQWQDIAQDGQVQFSVQRGDSLTGTIDFVRSAGQLSVQLKLFVNGEPDLNYIFQVKSIIAQ